MALTGAALLHLALDLPLHAGDGRPHFWPVTMWVYDSPVSYWDSRFRGRVVGALEAGACLGLAAWIWRRFRTMWVRATTAVLLALELLASGTWRIFF